MNVFDAIAPSLADFDALVDRALGEIPATFREKFEGVAIRVEDLPDDETVREMGLDSPYELTGLYSGTSLLDKSVHDPGGHPDMVFLYRLPILLEWCETGRPLGDVVREVLVHEIGHHFGHSDEGMDEIEPEDDPEAD